MDKFNETYTTAEKKTQDSLKKEEEKTGEADKTELSNEAFAIGELLESLIYKIEHARISMMGRK
jgi:hypothetical protein